MVNYICVKTVPDSTKLHIIKGPKSKFPQGSMPPDLPHALYMNMCLPPKPPLPPIIHTISFCPPLGKKLKETLYSVFLLVLHAVL